MCHIKTVKLSSQQATDCLQQILDSIALSTVIKMMLMLHEALRWVHILRSGVIIGCSRRSDHMKVYLLLVEHKQTEGEVDKAEREFFFIPNGQNKRLILKNLQLFKLVYWYGPALFSSLHNGLNTTVLAACLQLKHRCMAASASLSGSCLLVFWDLALTQRPCYVSLHVKVTW